MARLVLGSGLRARRDWRARRLLPRPRRWAPVEQDLRPGDEGEADGLSHPQPSLLVFFLSTCIKLGIALCSLCTMFRWCPESTRSHPILQIKETEASAFPESRQLINNGTGIRTKCKILGRGARRPGFESWLCQSPAVCPWHFAPSVVCDKTGVMTAPVPWGVL